ncbi:MAG: OmpH family outer membrane protein [Fimbriimonadaceae bacterium]|nr:OmpH family outer membrane protein [Fimbriimonadaceae bacterium]
MSKNHAIALAAAALLGLGLMASAGFQTGQDKFAVVDMNKVMNESKKGQKTRDSLQGNFRQRTGVLEFLNTNDVATEEQANRLRQLSLKENPTDADKSAVEALKDEIKKSVKEFNDLNLKSSPTPEDRTKLEGLNARRNTMKEKVIPSMQKEFDDEFNEMNRKMQGDLLTAAKAAVKEVAGKKGVTMVFESSVVMFSANDLTEDAVKAMDAKG